MAKKDLPTPEMLRNLLRYEPETGKLFWRERPVEMFANNDKCRCAGWNTRWAGKEALNYIDSSNGYKVGNLSGQKVYAHRIIWAIISGSYPEEIDHINGNRTDNRIKNIRACSRSENCKNLKRHKANTSGCTGVTRKGTSWRARIFDIHLGTFDRLEDAIDARKTAEKKYSFHPNHGRD